MTHAADANAALARAGDETAYHHRWLLLCVLLTGTFMLIADFSIVNVALPAIQDSLAATSGELQLIIAFYALAYSVLLITGGRLGDLFGRKVMLIAGMVGFVAASCACGLAPTIGMLVGARLLQGFAAAMMAPQILATIRVVFPPAERNRALGFYGATVGLGLVLGQLIGGVLIGLHPFGLQWEAIFLVNVPVGLADLAAAALLMPRDRPQGGVRLDVPGALILTLGLMLLVYPLVQGRESGWPAWTIVCLVLCIPVLAAFILVERRTAARGGAPLLDVRLFAERAFSVGLVLSFLVYASAAFFFSYAVYLQSGLHWNALAAGVGIVPIGVGFFFGSLLVPAAIARFGNGALLLGYVLGILGQGATALLLLEGQSSGPMMYAAIGVAGFGLGLVLPALIRIVLADIAPAHVGMASGALATAIQIGPALAIPIIGGAFFVVLGAGTTPGAYRQALAVVCLCIIATFVVSIALVAALKRTPPESGDVR